MNFGLKIWVQHFDSNPALTDVAQVASIVSTSSTAKIYEILSPVGDLVGSLVRVYSLGSL